MIREVTYYQAVCDVCGAVDDGGEFSAWAEADGARITAMEGASWTEVEARCDDAETGGHIYRVTTLDGAPKYSFRSILVCTGHPGDGVLWCRDCDEDLAEDAWAIAEDGRAEQACANGHWNAIKLGRSADE